MSDTPRTDDDDAHPETAEPAEVLARAQRLYRDPVQGPSGSGHTALHAIAFRLPHSPVMVVPLHTAIAALDAVTADRDAEIAALKADIERAQDAVVALKDLTSLVRGECPSLLDGDSDGDERLSMRIDDILAAAVVEAEE